jgi:hypothetical protein
MAKWGQMTAKTRSETPFRGVPQYSATISSAPVERSRRRESPVSPPLPHAPRAPRRQRPGSRRSPAHARRGRRFESLALRKICPRQSPLTITGAKLLQPCGARLRIIGRLISCPSFYDFLGAWIYDLIANPGDHPRLEDLEARRLVAREYHPLVVTRELRGRVAAGLSNGTWPSFLLASVSKRRTPHAAANWPASSGPFFQDRAEARG